MNLRAGQYQALGVGIGHKFTPNGAPVTQVEMLLGRAWTDGKWVKIMPAPEPFVGEWFLYKQNGEPSDHRWKMFQDVLGWDGVDLATLQALDISQKYFNVTLVMDKDNKYLQASFINPLGDPLQGSKKIEKAPVDALRAFSARAMAPKTAAGSGEMAEDNVPF